MIRSTFWVDRLAIGISVLCILHCLLTPLALLVLPSLGASFFEGETLHLWLVYLVIPSSLFALGIGCKQHRSIAVGTMGLTGLSLLALGVAAEPLGLHHNWEPTLTVAGATFIAFAHIYNFRLCRTSTDCGCH